MKVLIGGGGTGGHIYPALALARYAMAVDQGNSVLFIGSANGLESKIVPSAGFDIQIIPARGLQRNFKGFFSVVKDLFGGIRQSGKVIKSFRPNVVLGTGGYVAAPVVLSALLKRYPVVLHEQNALPGLTNRWLAPFVKKVCLSFKETEKKMPCFSRNAYTGNPRASEVLSLTREEGIRFFNLDPERKTLLIYGGSRGAMKLNQVVSDYLKEGMHPESLNLIYVSGEIYYRDISEKIGALPQNVRLFPYLEQMPEALAAADLAITRSGATTLAEITALGLPAILIPSPNVVNNHQYFNARLLSDVGAAVLIEEKDFDNNRLQFEINRLFDQPDLLEEMSRQSKILGIPDAAERLYGCLQEVAS
jgi:UDP-N-acetylglucosamine--N-acetylmuramyl-(pentapeptide) pyrophosphoryl-undecaprenol N-acetylglucosamine transferase